VKKSTLTKGLCIAVLLASPLAGAESKYPAANFQPGVVYQDSDLIAKHAARPAQVAPAPKAAVASSAATVQEKVSKSEIAGTVVKDEGFASNAPILLAVLGLIGFAFWFSKRSSSKTAQAAPAVAVAPVAGATGETGVARYLKGIGESAAAVGSAVAETGVARYIKSLPAAKAAVSETGVAKYLKNLSQ